MSFISLFDGTLLNVDVDERKYHIKINMWDHIFLTLPLKGLMLPEFSEGSQLDFVCMYISLSVILFAH